MIVTVASWVKSGTTDYHILMARLPPLFQAYPSVAAFFYYVGAMPIVFAVRMFEGVLVLLILGGIVMALSAATPILDHANEWFESHTRVSSIAMIFVFLAVAAIAFVVTFKEVSPEYTPADVIFPIQVFGVIIIAGSMLLVVKSAISRL